MQVLTVLESGLYLCLGRVMTVGPPIYLSGLEIWNMNQEDARLAEGRYLNLWH